MFHRKQWLLALVAWLVVVATAPVQAYTPKSPEVTAMLDKAAAFMAKDLLFSPGANALVALALLKAEKESSPFIARAAAECVEAARDAPTTGIGNPAYGHMIVFIFLSELDKQKYRRELEILLQEILKRQQANGCWGYVPHTYDDTSQTQYGVLCMWSAHHAGLQIPTDSVERAMMWFARVQDVGGGWTYQATDPKQNQRIAQGAVTHSMSSAGLGSVYICADLLGFRASSSAQSSQSGLPSALRKKESKEEKEERTRALTPKSTNAGSIASTTQLGNNWFAKNLQYEGVEHWTHYYMYGVERYKSFQEFVESRPEAEPKWYNDGVEYLRKTQAADGSWTTKDSHAGSNVIDTAFAVLFLTRSTKKAIQKTETGALRGGRSLPDDISDVRLDTEGKVISNKETPSVERLLSMLEDPTNPQADFINNMPNELALATDEKMRATQIERLRRMAISGSFQGRLTAVKAIGRDRNLDNVPALIFALSDPDFRVIKAAQSGLRFISRKFEGNELPEFPSQAEWRAAQAKWKEWYLSVRPNGQFIE